MYRKALALSLLGVLLMGTAAVAYGTAYGDGFARSLGAVLGQENDDHDKHKDRGKRDHDHDDD